MAEEIKEFNCKGKQLADYLVKHGSKLLRVENGAFIFEHDSSIDANLKQWEIDYGLYMF